MGSRSPHPEASTNKNPASAGFLFSGLGGSANSPACETGSAQRNETEQGNGAGLRDSRVAERKGNLQHGRTTTAFSVDELEGEGPGRPGIHRDRYYRGRGAGVEAQVDAADDQRQTVVMCDREGLPIGDRHDTGKLQ